MRPALRALVAGGLGFAVSLIAACGSGSQVLSADQASTLSTQLDQVQAALSRGVCTDVQSALSQLSAEIANVSNATARANLTEGYDTLQSQATAECHTLPPTTTPTTKAKTTTTTHTSTQTTPTITTNTQTAPTTPTATTPTPPGTNTNPGPGSGGAGLTPPGSGGSQGNGSGNGH
jgi:hypothetical protein